MLYLWMPEADGVWHWSRGESWVQASSLEQLNQDIQLYQGEEAVVFFPSRDVQIVQQTLTKNQYKQLGGDGVKYLLEEYVILPIDQMKVMSHFQAPDQVFIMGISNHAVLTMQHALTLLQIKVVSLLPDFLILPQPLAGENVLANIHGRLLVREHEWRGTSIDDLAVYLDLNKSQLEKFKYTGLNDDQLNSLFVTTTFDQRESYHDSFEPVLKAKQHPFNVLPKAKSNTNTWSGYWKASVLVLTALLVVQFSYDVVRWAKLKKNADQTAQLSIEQYQTWFGKNGRITEQNIKSLFESNLRLSQTANMQALQLLSRVGPILMQQQIVANQVSYDASILNMNLVARSADNLQSLVAQLNQQGFKAELGRIDTQGNSVVGMVKIQ